MTRNRLLIIIAVSAVAAAFVENIVANPPCYAPAQKFSGYSAGSYYAGNYARKFEDQEFRYRVGDYLRTKALREALLDRAADRLIDRSEALAREETAAAPQQPQPQQPSQPAPPVAQPPSAPGGALPAPPPNPAPTDESAAIQSAVQDLVTTNCVSCHNGQNKKTDLDLRDISQVTDRACLIWARVDLGTMPPSPHEPLSNVDTAKFRLWMATLIEGKTP